MGLADFDSVTWGFIFSIVGIAFGWTLNQLGQWLVIRQEDKRKLKIVLFNLLETYFILTRSDVDKFTSKVMDKVNAKLPEEERTEEALSLMSSVFSNLTEEHLKPRLSEDLTKVRISYESSIKTLASIDPIMAYSLSGKTDIIEYFDSIPSWFDRLKSDFPVEQRDIQVGAEQAISILKPGILQGALEELEGDIKQIAWKVNPYVYFQSRRVTNRMRKNAKERLDKEIDSLFEKLSPLFGTT